MDARQDAINEYNGDAAEKCKTFFSSFFFLQKSKILYLYWSLANPCKTTTTTMSLTTMEKKNESSWMYFVGNTNFLFHFRIFFLPLFIRLLLITFSCSFSSVLFSWFHVLLSVAASVDAVLLIVVAVSRYRETCCVPEHVSQLKFLFHKTSPPAKCVCECVHRVRFFI